MPPVQLATRGRLRAEAALAIMSRIELLRAEAGRSSADCAALAGGTAVVQGARRAWTVTGTAEVREVDVQVTIPNPRVPVADSVRVFFRCPDPPRDRTRRGRGGGAAHRPARGLGPRFARGICSGLGQIHRPGALRSGHPGNGAAPPFGAPGSRPRGRRAAGTRHELACRIALSGRRAWPAPRVADGFRSWRPPGPLSASPPLDAIHWFCWHNPGIRS